MTVSPNTRDVTASAEAKPSEPSSNGDSKTTFRYVHESKIEDYFCLGWMMTERPLMYEGDFRVWLMLWPCQCPHMEPKR